MKKTLLAAALVLLSAISAFADTKPTLTETLSAATVAVYQGKQICKWSEEPGMFGSEWAWGCEFKSQFVCTGTVIDSDGEGSYGGLTAGHCFNPAALDQYYIADGISDKPVLRHIRLIKFENDDRYDFAVFEFKSRKFYPIIDLDITSDVPLLGTKVLNVNFALGLTKQVIPGQVVSNIITEPIPRMKDIKGRYLVNVGIGPGASGSAVVDEKTGKIVGLVEMIFPGTQMPTVVMPTGKTVENFLEDDSAGLLPKKQEGAPPVEKAQDIEQHTDHDLNVIALSGASVALGLVLLIGALIKLRTKIKNGIIALYRKIRGK
jgi:Trypsin-like peptidase domain